MEDIIDQRSFIDIDCKIPKREDYSAIIQLETLDKKSHYIQHTIDWKPILDSLTVKEKHSPTSPYLDKKVAENFCLQYQRYLYLMCKYRSDVKFSPSLGMDLIWHAHILDTMAYHRDCHHLFGRYLHHYPYFGNRNQKDKENLDTSFNNTKKLYLLEFGEDFE